jgi:hypothetical protein
MPTAVWTAIIGGVFGLVTGSAVTAWVKWPIDKRRMKRQRQYEPIDTWRTGIAAITGLDHSDALNTPWYDTLRQYLSDDMRTRLEKPRTSYISIGSDRPPVRVMLAGEVDRIERQWGLRP